MFLNVPSALVAPYTGINSGRGASAEILKHIDGGLASPTGSDAWYAVGSDFLNFRLTEAVAANVGTYVDSGGGYLSYEDTGDSITAPATAVGGTIVIATDTTDNDEVWMQPGGATSVFGKVASSDGKKLLFECRVKVSSVADSTNWFVGMSEEGLAAADTVTDAGALASKDLLGFWVLEADGDALKFGYRKAGQTAVTVGTYGTALAADTYYKLGFVFDPEAEASKKIKFYVNGVEQVDGVAGSALDDATFPDGEELNFLIGLKNGSGAAKSLTSDWYYMAQKG